MLDPIEDLTDIRSLIEGDGQVALTPEEQRLRDEIVGLSEQLEALTRWPRNELLDQIGCDQRDPDRLVKDPGKFERCRTFLKLILGHANLVDTLSDRRAVVRSCARLSKATKDHVSDLGDLLKTGAPSPSDYIGLGEIATAVHTARVAVGVDRPLRETGPNPYDLADEVHITPPRLELYARGERGLLGEQVSDRMAEHIRHCDACAGALGYQRARVAHE